MSAITHRRAAVRGERATIAVSLDRSRANVDSLRAAAAKGRKKPRVQSVGRGFDVLFAIARSDSGLKAREIVEQTLLNRQTVYHIIHSLVAIGVITKNRDNKFVLGLKIAALAEGFKRHLAPPELLGPVTREVAARTGETAYAVGWWEAEIAVMASARGSNAVSAKEVPQGMFGYAHARASGKLLLSLLSPMERDKYIAGHKLEIRTPKTIRDRVRLEKELEQIRKDGFAVDHEEYLQGLCCMAVPIGDVNSGFAIAISAPVERFDAKRRLLLRTLREIAQKAEGTC